jgi:type IV secretory pathway protease TraF
MTRFGYVVTTYSTTLAVGLSAFLHLTPKLIWNASASVPIGLYTVRPAGVLHVTELVVIRPPEPLSSFLADRGYFAQRRAAPEARPCPFQSRLSAARTAPAPSTGSRWAKRSSGIGATGRCLAGRAAAPFRQAKSS